MTKKARKIKKVKLAINISLILTILGVFLGIHLKNFGWHVILWSSGCGIIFTYFAGIFLRALVLLAPLLFWPIAVGIILWAGAPNQAIGQLILYMSLAISLLAGITFLIICSLGKSLNN